MKKRTIVIRDIVDEFLQDLSTVSEQDKNLHTIIYKFFVENNLCEEEIGYIFNNLKEKYDKDNIKNISTLRSILKYQNLYGKSLKRAIVDYNQKDDFVLVTLDLARNFRNKGYSAIELVNEIPVEKFKDGILVRAEKISDPGRKNLMNALNRILIYPPIDKDREFRKLYIPYDIIVAITDISYPSIADRVELNKKWSNVGLCVSDLSKVKEIWRKI